jgi:acetyl esterase/lipase
MATNGPSDAVTRVGRTNALVVLALAGIVACGGGSDDALPTLTFYEPSTVLGDGEPGDILERSPITLQSSIAGVGTRVTFAYTTPAGDLVPVTGVVIQPLTPPPPGGYPVVVWGHGTVGLGDPCAPSRAEPFGFAGARELAAAGFLLVAPDYEGLGVEGETHPYLVGIATGDNLLDGVRLGRSFGGGGRFVVFGASQGGHATLFARQRAGDYLPEGELLGVVAAVPVTDVRTFLLPGRTDPTIFPFVAEAILAWSEVYEETELSDLVVVEDANAVRLARDEWCTSSLTPPRPLDDIFLEEPEDLEVWATAMTMNTPGADDLGVPVLLTHGDADVTVPLSGTEALHHALCRAGEDVVFLRDPAWDHVTGWIEPIPRIVDWIVDRFAGEPPPNDCDAD